MKVEKKGESTDKNRDGDSHNTKVETLDKINEEIKIDLEEPDVDTAALKIQSCFRDHKAKKKVSQEKKPADKLIIIK